MTQASATARLGALPVWLAPFVVLLVGGSVVTNLRDGTLPVVVVPTLLAVVCAVAAPWRPGVCLAVAGAAVGTYWAVGGADGPIYLTVPVVALVASLMLPIRRAAVLAAGAVALVWVGLLVGVVADRTSGSTVWPMIGILALTAAAVAIGAVVRERRAIQSEQTRRAAVEEQLRMAQDLHDGVGHGLAVVAMQAGVALHVLDRDPAQVRASLEAIRDTSRQSLEELRGALLRLGAGTDAAPTGPRRGLADLPQLLDRVRTGGLDVRYDGVGASAGDDVGGGVDDDVGAVAYLVVQESLTNVLRHAGASRADVRLAVADGLLHLSVTDDGAGTDGSSPGLGMGLPGMRARVETHGGTFACGPEATGYAVRAELPVGGAR